MEIVSTKKRTIKLIALTAICVVLLASLSGCLSSCIFDSELFDEYLDQLFVSMLDGDALSINILIDDPSAFNFEDMTASLPLPVESAEEYAEQMKSINNVVALFKKFDYDGLNFRQKCDYDTVIDYFSTQAQYAPYYYMQDQYLGSSGGWNVVLPLYLDKYVFKTKTDIDNWISLVEQTSTAFPKYIEFEKKRIAAGYGRAEYIYKGIADQATEMANAFTDGKHFLEIVFDEKVSACDFLSDVEKANYTERATTAIKVSFIPSYQNLANEMSTLEGDFNNLGICYFDGGKEYYKLLFKDNASSSDAIEIAYVNLQNAYNSTLNTTKEIFAKLASLGVEKEQALEMLDELSKSDDLTKKDFENIYSALKTAYSADFPVLPDSIPDATFKEVPAAMANFYNPASYFKSAIDSASSEETIYINTQRESSYVGFDLIAHEGIPGHQLQHAYSKTCGISKLRTVLGYTGYAEGWATYAQYYAQKYYEGTDIEKLIYKLF
ncbi:MAG: DUF885 domain-containing protein, partial [Clostridia bacterium]|nr:DUF885 domain-containing protein [Clostridia bacterium]